MKKFLMITVLFALLVTFIPASLVSAQGGGEDYTVQADDSLSKLADKFFGDINAYWAIMSATNQANAEDPSYVKITNPDIIEVGSKLRVPSAEDAQAFMATFDPANADVGALFASGAGVVDGPAHLVHEQAHGLAVHGLELSRGGLDGETADPVVVLVGDVLADVV